MKRNVNKKKYRRFKMKIQFLAIKIKQIGSSHLGKYTESYRQEMDMNTI